MRNIIDSLFGPIARLLVARGVVFAEASERFKVHYVQAARALAGAKPTDSRLSVMTGLQRREVARLSADPAMETRPHPVNHMSRLVALWQTDARFAGKALPRYGGEGSFEALVQAIRRDVHPKTVLEQLLAAGTVATDNHQAVHLLERSYQPLPGSEEQLAYFSDNAQDFLSAAVGNILSDRPPFFERSVHYNGLSDDAVAELDQIFRQGQMALLLSLRDAATRLRTQSPGKVRFRAGGYFFAKDQE